MTTYGKAIKMWPRYHRMVWQNDGGPVPYAFRGRVQRRKGKPGLWAVNPLQRVGLWQWVVLAGDDTFVFTSAIMKRMYTTSAPDDRP